MTKGTAKDTPIFMGHGTADPVVQYECEPRCANVE